MLMHAEYYLREYGVDWGYFMYYPWSSLCDERYSSDVEKLKQYRDIHPPFPLTAKLLLISSAIVGTTEINCHNGSRKGDRSVKQITCNEIGNVSFKRKDEVRTLALNEQLRQSKRHKCVCSVTNYLPPFVYHKAVSTSWLYTTWHCSKKRVCGKELNQSSTRSKRLSTSWLTTQGDMASWRLCEGWCCRVRQIHRQPVWTELCKLSSTNILRTGKSRTQNQPNAKATWHFYIT